MTQPSRRREGIWRVIAPVTSWFRARFPGTDVPSSIRMAAPVLAKPKVPAAYMPLYVYLDGRSADTVVLTFEEIEALLGFVPPTRAFGDAAWWTGPSEPNDSHRSAWTAAHRSAAPRLRARIVAFERQR